MERSWLGQILRGLSEQDVFGFANTYFRTYTATLRSCHQVDNGVIINRHYELRTDLFCTVFHQLNSEVYHQFGGKLTLWFRHLMDSGQSNRGVERSCWRTLDGKRLCSGTGTSLDVVVSTPVLLLIELCGEDVDKWHIPSRLQLVTKKNWFSDEVLNDSYHLAGRLLWSQDASPSGHTKCQSVTMTQSTPPYHRPYGIHADYRTQGFSLELLAPSNPP